jgi:colicin import membrane protein
MRAFLREHSWPVAASVLLHGLLAAGLLLTAMMSHRPSPSLQPLPMDAVVVDSRVLHAAQQAQADRAAQELARAQAEAKAAADAKAAAAAAEAEAADSRAADEAKAQAAAQADADAEAKAAAAKAATQAKQAAAADAARAAAAEQQRLVAAQKATEAQKAAQAQQGRAEAAADARRAAEAKKALEAKQAADAKQAAEAKQAADAKRAADERAKQDRETELRRQLADEEHTSAVESGPLRNRYIAALRNAIQNAWIKPDSARAGVDCQVEVTQVAGGAVTSAHVTQCNGDAAVRQSIENAVYRASPLPDPPDPALFERNFVFRFKPNE